MKDVIVIPTYNEKGNIQVIIPEIFRTVPDIYVMVTDDNSPDGTAAEVLKLMKSYPRLSLYKREKKEGLGKAYVSSFLKLLADPEVRSIITMDADLSHNPKYLTELLKNAGKGVMVVGSRYIKGGTTTGWSAWRRHLSKWGNLYARTITGTKIYDCTSGFNLIDSSLLRKIDLAKIDSSGYAFTIELKTKLSRKGAILKEIPIEFTERREGESKISTNIIREGLIAPWKMRYTLNNEN